MLTSKFNATNRHSGRKFNAGRLRFKSDGGAIKDPYVTFRYKVEIDGVTVGHFFEASGLNVTTDIEEYKEGGENFMVHKLMSTTKSGNITLKQGMTSSKTLWDWRQRVISNRPNARLNCSIALLGDKPSEEIARWEFRGWPCKWDGPQLNSKGNDVAVETIEFATEYIKRTK